MPTFTCDVCGCRDNSACGGTYWTSNFDPPLYPPPFQKGQRLCVACTPATYRDGSRNERAGVWHDRFPRCMPDGSPFVPPLPKEDQDQGWEPYGATPFVEDLDRIMRACSSYCYETLTFNGYVWVRRLN